MSVREYGDVVSVHERPDQSFCFRPNICLPFFLAFAISLLNPGYLHPLLHSSSGHMLVTVGVVMMLIGSVLLKKIVSFKG